MTVSDTDLRSLHLQHGSEKRSSNGLHMVQLSQSVRKLRFKKLVVDTMEIYVAAVRSALDIVKDATNSPKTLELVECSGRENVLQLT